MPESPPVKGASGLRGGGLVAFRPIDCLLEATHLTPSEALLYSATPSAPRALRDFPPSRAGLLALLRRRFGGASAAVVTAAPETVLLAGLVSLLSRHRAYPQACGYACGQRWGVPFV